MNKCPFCNGNAKLSAKDHRFGGYSGLGCSRREYLLKVICNKCKARGPVVNTGWVQTTYGCYKRQECHVSKEDVAAFSAAEEKAITLWNHLVWPYGKLLTLSELQQMEGEIVYIPETDIYHGGSGIVENGRKGVFDKNDGGLWLFDDYGEWLAYSMEER